MVKCRHEWGDQFWLAGHQFSVQNFKAKLRKRPHMHHHHHHHFIYLSISTKNLSMWWGDPRSHQAYWRGHLTFDTTSIFKKKIKCCKCAAWLAQNFKAKRRKRPHMHHHHHHHFIYLSISTKNLSMWQGDPGSHQAYGTGHLTFNTTGIFKKD